MKIMSGNIKSFNYFKNSLFYWEIQINFQSMNIKMIIYNELNNLTTGVLNLNHRPTSRVSCNGGLVVIKNI